MTTVFTLGSVLVLCAGIALIDVTLDRQLTAALDADLRARSADLAAQPASATSRWWIDPMAQLYDANGRLIAGSDTLDNLRLLPAERAGRLSDPTLETITLGADGPAAPDVVRVLSIPVDATRTLSVAVSVSPLQEAQDRLPLVLLLIGPLLIGFVALIGWWAVRAALRPVDLLTTEAGVISSLHEPRHLPVVPGNDEIARLARTLDAMLTRLQVSFERERGFVDDASHELRSPIAVLRGELELALSTLDDPAEVERSLHAALAETDRLTRLAEDLLLLARERAGSLVVRQEPVDLVELAATEAQRLGPALELSVSVVGPAKGEPAVVEGDPNRLRQVVANTLHNSSESERRRCRSRCPGTGARSPSSSPTTAPDSHRASCRRRSTASSVATRPGPPAVPGPGWGFPSSEPSSPRTTARSKHGTVHRWAAQFSRSGFPRRGPARHEGTGTHRPLILTVRRSIA